MHGSRDGQAGEVCSKHAKDFVGLVVSSGSTHIGPRIDNLEVHGKVGPSLDGAGVEAKYVGIAT